MNTEKQTTAIEPKAALAMTSRGFEPTDIEQAYRYANAISQSPFVPTEYKGNPGACMIALDLSMRWGVHWLTVMQHVYIVHGRPALDSQLCISLVNKSGLFTDPIEYEVQGDDAKDKDYRVRAYATRESTGKVLYGPWIDWSIVKGEGWDKKQGSKWVTMPDQMFHYRAASWFQRRFCPEVTMGMLTAEEAEEVPERKPVESVTFDEAQAESDEVISKEMGSEVIGLPDDKAETTEDDEPTEEETAPDEKPAKRGRPKKQKDEPKVPKFAYQCDSKTCGIGFDEPEAGGGGVLLCPKCLSSEVHATGQ